MHIGALVQNFAGFPDTGQGPAACVELAQHAERVGLASVWVTDHVVLPEVRSTRYPHDDRDGFPYTWEQDIHDPLSLMGALAQVTSRVLIGAAVLVIPYRHPLVVAKQLATIDQLAGGRVVLGAGVGWLRDEFDALGLLPEVYEHRGSVTEDYLAAMRAAWTSPGPARHEGPWVRFGPVGTRPQPPRGGHLPVWIGGKGERALRRAATLGEGYLGISSDPATLAAECARLGELADAAGRQRTELTVALIDGIVVHDRPLGADRHPLHGTAGQIVEGLRAFADAGLDHLVAGIRSARAPTLAGTLSAMETVAAEVLPQV